ncbi:hypothetical protein C5167_029270 [Papaver somniferum]|nr:hypothetical protein C5167_029270 [Papaver somniferum]
MGSQRIWNLSIDRTLRPIGSENISGPSQLV